MDAAWPWLAVAAAGVLHGLNPASGWALLACGGRAGWARSLLPLAAGHVAGIAAVGAGLPVALQLRLAVDAAWLQAVAAGLVLAHAALHLRGHRHHGRRGPLWQAGLAAWSILASVAHGAGLALLPTLAPLCAGAAFTPDTLLPALAALALHLAAMLATTAALAAGAFLLIAEADRPRAT